MSEAQARYFTEVDQCDHVAWCGVAPAMNRRGYGITRFVRDRVQRDKAEFAIAVIDEMQRKGLGTILLATLYLLAQAAGVGELWGEVLTVNPVMALWLTQLGATLHPSGDPSYRIIRWPVDTLEKLPDTLAAMHFSRWVSKLQSSVVPEGHNL